MFRSLLDETGTPEQIERRKRINTHMIDADIWAAKMLVFIALVSGFFNKPLNLSGEGLM